MNRVAIIDIGSNSLKLIISDIYDNKFFQISYEKKTKLRLSNYKTRANDITALGIKKLTSSLEEMKNAIKEYINSNKLRENEWICGRGWNHDYFNDVNRFPTKDDLDEISTEYPICIIRACGHVCVVNSKALELAGINKNTLQIKMYPIE